MSSKRGRKRNDNLPPNRARDVQRAFRARRAAHLQALELRVSELEEENSYLRHILDLPPSTRTPLGKGPTGKDRPKAYQSVAENTSADQALPPPSRESSTVDSPGSRKRSSSPNFFGLGISMPTRPIQVIESGSSWNEDLMIGSDHQPDMQPSTSSSCLTPMAAPSPLKPPYPSYSVPLSSSRNSMSSDIYVSSNSVHSQSSDRSLSQSYSEQSFTLRHSEMHEDSPRSYSYTPHFHTYDHASMHSPSPSPGTTLQPQHRHQQLQHRDSSASYASSQRQRRMTIPQGFQIGPGYANIHHPSQTQAQSVRQVNLIHSQDEVEHLASSRHSAYSLDGRLNHQTLS